MSAWRWVAVVSALLGFAWPWMWLVTLAAMEADRGGADLVAVWLEGRSGRWRE